MFCLFSGLECLRPRPILLLYYMEGKTNVNVCFSIIIDFLQPFVYIILSPKYFHLYPRMNVQIKQCIDIDAWEANIGKL